MRITFTKITIWRSYKIHSDLSRRELTVREKEIWNEGEIGGIEQREKKDGWMREKDGEEEQVCVYNNNTTNQ